MNQERLLKIIEDMQECIADINECLEVLENGVIEEDTYIFLEKSRLIRNRISHRYKEPKHEELLEHFLKYNSNFDDIVKIAKLYVL